MIIQENQKDNQSPPSVQLADITVKWQRLAHAPVTIDCVVVMPTFKRPDHARTTLASVLAQKTSRTFAIVVMDNHPEGQEGADATVPMLETSPHCGVVLLALRRGNCAAYNAGFRTALTCFPSARHVLIIDDDEIAPPNWIEALLDRAEATNADCTGAPQYPVFAAGSDETMSAHPVFLPPFTHAGPAPILYSSGNVAIKTELLRAHGDPWLDERFNFLGGGDSDFYDRSKRQGARFAWEPDAAVDETTPARRTELSWLNSRSLRNGSISALIQKRAASNRTDHAKRILKTLALIAVSPFRDGKALLRTGRPALALNAMHVAIGRLLMEFGFANEQYRAAEKN